MRKLDIVGRFLELWSILVSTFFFEKIYLRIYILCSQVPNITSLQCDGLHWSDIMERFIEITHILMIRVQKSLA